MQMLFIHAHMNKHSHCFQPFVFITNAGMNISVHLNLSTCLRYIPRESNHWVVGKVQTAFQNCSYFTEEETDLQRLNNFLRSSLWLGWISDLNLGEIVISQYAAISIFLSSLEFSKYSFSSTIV